MEFLPEFIDSLFKLAVIQRWNDHPRPFNITELDKQGQKAIVAYLLAKIEERERGKSINWKGLFEGLLFEALQRAVFTDLKPRLFHKLQKSKRREMNRFLFETYRVSMEKFNKRLWQNFKSYFDEEDFLSYEKYIIRASHFIPTYWEFQFIYPVARAIYRIDRIKEELENTLEDFHHLVGIQRFLLKRKLYGFVNLCGQLRFQKRWISVERIPQTSVMGHLFFVSTTVYLLMVYLSKFVEISERAFYSTFLTALLHDLPEIITRDIISTLKRVLGKEEIRKVEMEGMESEVLNLLPDYVADEIRVFLAFLPQSSNVDEFTNRHYSERGFEVFGDEKTEFLKRKEGFPIWGSLVKFADLLSAYYEAYYTLKYGLRNGELERALKDLEGKLKGSPIVKVFPELVKLIKA